MNNTAKGVRGERISGTEKRRDATPSEEMFLFGLTSAEEKTENDTRLTAKQLSELIMSMSDGDTTHMSELYKYTKTAVYSFALSILKNRHDAEDVMQDTFVKIFKSAAYYSHTGNPMSWILTITKNNSLMRLRERNKNFTLPDEDWNIIEDAPADVSPEEKMLLSEILAKLTDQERSVILLHTSSGLKHREIAALLDMPLATVLSKYHRAIKKLRKYYEGGENRE